MNDFAYDSNISFLTEIYELNQLDFEITKETLKYMHQYKISGNESILVEGFLDSVSKMGDFFKRMIDKIKDFFKKIFMYINACFMDIDKFVKKYKDELSKIRNVKFDINGYKFTPHDVPNMVDFIEVVDNYNSEIADVSKLKKDDILKRQNEYLKTENLDKIRGRVLGVNTPIEEDDFHEEVLKYYRDGEVNTHVIEVDDSLFNSTISEIPTLMKEKKAAEQTRDQLISLLDKTQRFFDQKIGPMYDGGAQKLKTTTLKLEDKGNRISTDEENITEYKSSYASAVEAFVRYKYIQVNKLASIVNLVATERANAYKAQVKQAREIIRGGITNSGDKTKEDSTKSNADND